MSKVKYNFIQNDTNGDIVFQSTAESFGLDHITEKDFESFYTNFSKTAHFDTGLLPVDGSGMLSIRTAGNHTQIGYQYAPGMYFINWGAFEGDPQASKLYVAQPYRIVIADLYNGNLLGARTFYSPISIHHPSAPLYHVNLPNINCKGYRNNAVGWICLYHNEDISMYPFNEKVAKVLERCSGVEAYNDANMSETDGPRLYKDKSKPSHIWNPQEWEKYSAEHGYEWMMDPDLLIPVLVQDMDHQDKHYDDGQPLTYSDAVLGSYRAYYYDENPDKLYNTLMRDDRTVNQNELFNFFKKAYNSSTVYGQPVKKTDPFSESIKVRQDLSTVFIPIPQDEDEDEFEEEDKFSCESCDGLYSSHQINSTLNDETVCEICIQQEGLWIEHAGGYVLSSSDDAKWLDATETAYYKPLWKQVISCLNCSEWYPYDQAKGYTSSNTPLYMNHSTGEPACISCSLDLEPCSICGEMLVGNLAPKIIDKNNFLQTVKVCNVCWFESPNSFKDIQQDLNQVGVCLCGEIHLKSSFTQHKSDFNNLHINYYSATNGTDYNKELVTQLINSKWIISNEHLVDAFIDNHGVEKVINNFNFTFSSHISCPTCKEVRYTGDYAQDMSTFKNIVENCFPEILQNIQPDQQIFGLKIVALPSTSFNY